MKKLFFTIVAAVYATSLFAQQASQWSLSSVKSDVKTLIPVLFGLENYKKILSNALYAVIVIAIITGLIYAGMNVLLR